MILWLILLWIEMIRREEKGRMSIKLSEYQRWGVFFWFFFAKASAM